MSAAKNTSATCLARRLERNVDRVRRQSREGPIVTQISPREALAQALDPYGDIARIAVAAGVSPRQMMNAQSARPVATVAYLRICAAIRFNPLSALPHIIPEPSDFDFAFFSMAFFIKRRLNGHNDREAAAAIEASATTVCRIERGDAMFIGVVLRACQYIGISPFGYFCVKNPPIMRVSANVPRETLNAVS